MKDKKEEKLDKERQTLENEIYGLVDELRKKEILRESPVLGNYTLVGLKILRHKILKSFFRHRLKNTMRKG